MSYSLRMNKPKKGPYVVAHASDFDERNKPRVVESVSWPTLESARAAFEVGRADVVMLMRFDKNGLWEKTLDKRDSR